LSELTLPELKLIETLPELPINMCFSQTDYDKVLMEHTREYQNTALTF